MTQAGELKNMDETATQRQNQFESVFGLRSADQSWPNLLQGVAQATQQLLTSSDYATGVNLALATLGQVTGVDRVYIFEFHPHPETGEDAVSQRFGWARDAVTTKFDNPSLQNLTRVSLRNPQCDNAFSAGSAFSALVRDLPPAERQILELKGILSILLVPIPLNGKLWGFIGFDDCHSYRVWSKDEEAVLMTMAATLGSAIANRQTSVTLQQTELRLQKIAANVPGMIYQELQRPDGSRSVLYTSSGCRELLELEPEAVKADFPAELIHPDDRKAYEQSIATSATSQQPWQWEGRIVTASGKLKWIQCASRLERQSNGNLLQDGLIVDITERKQSEARYKAILDAIPDLMFRLSRDGVYLDCKGDSLEVAISKDAIIGKNVWALLPPDVAQISLDAIGKALDSETLQTLEYQLPTPLGMRDYEARLVVSGKDEVLAIVRDITERKKAEVALCESEEKFSKAFRCCPDVVTLSTLQEGRYIDINDAFSLLTQFNRDEVIGHTSLELNLWVNQEDRAQVVQMLLAKGAVCNLEVEFRKKNGEVVVVLLSSEIIDLAGEQCMLCVSNDITERKRAEMQLQLSAQRDRLLAEIASRVRCSLDLDQILNTTVEEVRQFLQCDRVFISRLNDNLQVEVFAESVSESWESVSGILIEEKGCIKQLGALFEKTGVSAIDDVMSAELPSIRVNYFARYHVKACLAVPVLQGENVFGALVAHQCSSSRHWQPMEIELLKQLATQVAIAIQQAELYQQVQAFNANLERQVQERTQQLEQRNQELQELNQLKDVFLHAVTHDLRTPVMGWLLVLKNLLNIGNGEEDQEIRRPGHQGTLALAERLLWSQGRDSTGQGEFSNASPSPKFSQSPSSSRSLIPNSQSLIPVSRSILERMILSCDRQLYMINSLLDVHAKEVQGVILQREPVHPKGLIQAILQDLEPLFVKNQATLKNLIPDDLPTLSADPAQLWRVFENLITNAFKHNLPGLRLTLKATVEERRLIRFVVEDNGVGIDQQACASLFELYVRGSHARRSPGLGLGLYLCRQIVTAHGGEIGVTSSPGAGAKFWFTLPL